MIKELKLALECLSEHKAEDIAVLDVSQKTPFATFYVLTTCINERALDSTANILADDFRKGGFTVDAVDGKPETGWIVVKANEVVVHLFTDKQRKTIDLDTLFLEAKKIKVPTKKSK